MSSYIDYDQSDGLNLFQQAYDLADKYLEPRMRQYELEYQTFHSYYDMSTRDPARFNVTLPIMASIIKTRAPRIIRALFGRRPFIPFDSKRKEYKEIARLQSEMLDQLLYLAGFKREAILMMYMVITYGTAFMEAFPYFEDYFQKVLIPQYESIPGLPEPLLVNMVPQRIKLQRLRLQVQALAPWQVLMHPSARNLEQTKACPFVIKIKPTTRSEVLFMAKQGAFGGDFDVEKLSKPMDFARQKENRGFQILRNMGMPDPEPDGEMGVIFSYESEDRYVLNWNDVVTLRDTPNPFAKEAGGHGLINLSEMIYEPDPHTSNRAWGNSDVKLHAPLCDAMNDHFNLTMDANMGVGLPRTFYATDRGMADEDIKNVANWKTEVTVHPGEDIRNFVYVDRGQNLSSDWYNLFNLMHEMVREGTGIHEPLSGTPITGQHTLGEIGMLREAGDSRIELNVTMGEDPFLRDFGHKCLCHIDQFARRDQENLLRNDVYEILGEDGLQLEYLHPRDIPGSFNFTFIGSDGVINKQMRQLALDKLNGIMTQSPYTKIREWQRIMLEANDLSDEVDTVLRSEEEMQMMQMQAQQIEAGKSERERANSLQDFASKENIKGQTKMRSEESEYSRQGQQFNPAGLM